MTSAIIASGDPAREGAQWPLSRRPIMTDQKRSEAVNVSRPRFIAIVDG